MVSIAEHKLPVHQFKRTFCKNKIVYTALASVEKVVTDEQHTRASFPRVRGAPGVVAPAVIEVCKPGCRVSLECC